MLPLRPAARTASFTLILTLSVSWVLPAYPLRQAGMEESSLRGPLEQRLLAAGAEEKPLELLETFPRPPEVRHGGKVDGKVTGLSLDQRSGKIVAAYDDGSVYLLPLKAIRLKEEEGQIQKLTLLGSQPFNVLAAAFNKRVVAWTEEDYSDGSIQIYGLSKGNTTVIDEDVTFIQSLAFSSDGKKLAAGYISGPARIWDVSGKQPRFEKQLSGGPHQHVVFSPDGLTLATGNQAGELRLFDVKSKRELMAIVFREQDEYEYGVSIESLAFSPDGKMLAVGASFRGRGKKEAISTLYVIDFSKEPFEEVVTLPETQWVRALAFSPDGRFLAAGLSTQNVREPGQIVLWKRDFGQVPWKRIIVPAAVTALAFSRDGNSLIAGGMNGEVSRWRIPSPGAAAGAEENVEKLVSKHPILRGHNPGKPEEVIREYKALLSSGPAKKAGWTVPHVGIFMIHLEAAWQELSERLPGFPVLSSVRLVSEPKRPLLHLIVNRDLSIPRATLQLNLNPGRYKFSADRALDDAFYRILIVPGELVPDVIRSAEDLADPKPRLAFIDQELRDEIRRFPDGPSMTPVQAWRAASAMRIIGGLPDNPWVDAPELLDLDRNDPNVIELIAISPRATTLGKPINGLLAVQFALLIASEMDGTEVIAQSLQNEIDAELDALERFIQTRPVPAQEFPPTAPSPASSFIFGLGLQNPLKSEILRRSARWEEDLSILSFLAYARTWARDPLEDLEDRILDLEDKMMRDLEELKPLTASFVPDSPLLKQFMEADWRAVYQKVLKGYQQLVSQTRLRSAASGDPAGSEERLAARLADPEVRADLRANGSAEIGQGMYLARPADLPQLPGRLFLHAGLEEPVGLPSGVAMVRAAAASVTEMRVFYEEQQITGSDMILANLAVFTPQELYAQMPPADPPPPVIGSYPGLKVTPGELAVLAVFSRRLGRIVRWQRIVSPEGESLLLIQA